MKTERPMEPLVLDYGLVDELESAARHTLEGLLEPSEVAERWEDEGLLDRLLEVAGTEVLHDDGVLAALGIVLGRHLVRVCKLEWVDDPAEEELGVRLPGTAVLFYPRRMVDAQWELARQQDRLASLRLAWLVASTRDYLRGLVRFYPTQPT